MPYGDIQYYMSTRKSNRYTIFNTKTIGPKLKDSACRGERMCHIPIDFLSFDDSLSIQSLSDSRMRKKRKRIRIFLQKIRASTWQTTKKNPKKTIRFPFSSVYFSLQRQYVCFHFKNCNFFY